MKPLRMDKPTLKAYNRIVNDIQRNPQQITNDEDVNKSITTAIARDTYFQSFLSSFNPDDLEWRQINFARDTELVEILEDGLMKNLEKALSVNYSPGELHRIGSCHDGSKVGKVNELDYLYVMNNTHITAIEQGGNAYQILVDGRVQKPDVLQKKLAKTIESFFSKWKWDNPCLIHGGYTSPEFSGTRYNGPAVTLVMIYIDRNKSEKRLISLDVTVAFVPPVNDTFADIREQVQRRFDLVKKTSKKKLLDLNGIHLVPNISGGTWQATTASLEATFFRDLPIRAPIKQAFAFVKIANHDLTESNESDLFHKLTRSSKDEAHDICEQVKRNCRISKRFPDSSMRYAHAFLHKDVAKEVNEIGKSDISWNTAGVKHVLLNEALDKPEMFMEAATKTEQEDLVYHLVVKTIQKLSESKTPLPKTPHAILSDAEINILTISKRAFINGTHTVLQDLLVKETKLIYIKINIEKWPHDSIGEDTPKIPVISEGLKYPEYMYGLDVDLSISPTRNPMVPCLLQVINGLMNTCGGIITAKHKTNTTSIAVGNWVNRLGIMFVERKMSMYLNKVTRDATNYEVCIDPPPNIRDIKLHKTELKLDNIIDLPYVQITVFVKPAAKYVWLPPHAKSIRFEILEDGTFNHVTDPTHMNMEVATNTSEKIGILSGQESSHSEHDIKRTSDTNDGQVDIKAVLKGKPALSLTAHHRQPWESFVDFQLPNISNRLETMAAIFKLAQSFPLHPSTERLPEKLKDQLGTIHKRYENCTGFGIWFYNLNALDTVQLSEDHVWLICYIEGEGKFDLFSVYGHRPASVTEIGLQNIMNDVGKHLKWRCIDLARKNGWMVCDSGSLNVGVSCHCSWNVLPQENNTYPLCTAPPGKDVSLKLAAVLTEIVIKENKDPIFEKTLHSNLLLQLTYDQCQHMTDFGKHALNFVEGPPGSGKTIIASFLCDICMKEWKTKPTYLCASRSLKAVLDAQDNCHARLINNDTDLIRHLHDIEGSGENSCFIVDDAQNMDCSEDSWAEFIIAVSKKKICLYVFADHQYQNFRTHASLCLAELISSIGESMRVSYNRSFLSKVHRNTQKVASFIAAGFCNEADTSTKITCCHNASGDDVQIVKVSKLNVYDKDNGLLHYIQSVKEFEQRHIAIMVDGDDTDNVIMKIIKMIQTCMEAPCKVHRADVYPAEGITVDHLDNFVGIDAPLCIFPIFPNSDRSRQLHNPKYRAFIASRAIFQLILLQPSDFDVSLTDQFGLDHRKIASDRSTAPAETPPAGTAPAETPPAGTAPAETPPAGTAPPETPPAGTAPAETPPAGTAPPL